jgi:hypothetical protein
MRMTSHDLLGRVLMSVGTAIAGFIPLLVDLSPSHVLNPAWPAHARLHEVWLLGTGGSLALVALYFIWFRRGERRFAVTLAAVLVSCLLGGFFIAAATESRYGGVLVDPVTAPMMPNQDMMLGIPLNMFAFAIAWLLLLIGMGLARGASRSSAPVA